MIKLDVIDNRDQHFLVSSDGPVRIEVSVIAGRVVADVYEGHHIETEQEPLGCYDGNIGPENQSWEFGGVARIEDRTKNSLELLIDTADEQGWSRHTELLVLAYYVDVCRERQSDDDFELYLKERSAEENELA